MSVPPPDYPVHFSCIGPKCEDACCNLDVPLSREEYERFGRFKSAHLRSLTSQFVSLESIGTSTGSYARLTRRPSGECGFYTQERLCAVQGECGEAYLPQPCFLYPRVLNRVEGVLEGALHLSCPEAARQVLFSQDLLRSEASSGLERFDGSAAINLRDRLPGSPTKPYQAFTSIRHVLIQQILDRTHPLWKRLLTIGAMCKGLDGDALCRFDRNFLASWERRSKEELACAVSDQAPDQAATRLDLFFKLTTSLIHDAPAPARFQEIFWRFAEGIGAGTASDSANDVTSFLRNEQRYYRPFFDRNPSVLENYLLNYMFKNLFPFGRTDTLRIPFSGFFNEYLVMASQFAWLETLMIGVSGSNSGEFSQRDVVQVVQPFCRVLEHDSTTSLRMLTAIRQRGLDSLEGSAVLLRTVG